MITIPFHNLINEKTKSIKVKQFKQNNFNLFNEIFSINDHLSNTPLIVNNKNDLLLIAYRPDIHQTHTFLLTKQGTQGLGLSQREQNYNIALSLQVHGIHQEYFSQHEIDTLLETYTEESYDE